MFEDFQLTGRMGIENLDLKLKHEEINLWLIQKITTKASFSAEKISRVVPQVLSVREAVVVGDMSEKRKKYSSLMACMKDIWPCKDGSSN